MISNRQCELMNTRPNSEKAAQATLIRMGYKVVPQKCLKVGYHTYYADLYLPELRLVVEIDGGYHFTAAQQKKDKTRAAALRRIGVHVYRLKAADAYHPKKIAAKLAYFRSRQGSR